MDESLSRWNDTVVHSLRLAVEDLTQTFGSRYANGPEYLRRLEDVETTIAEARAASPPDLQRWFDSHSPV